MYHAITHLTADGGAHAQMGWGMDGWGQVIVMVVFALLLAVVVFALVRLLMVPIIEGSESRLRDRSETDRAREVLRERFARGEIDEDEYERRKGILEHDRA